MQYLIYFAVATPLLLGWLFFETAGVPQPPPMFHSFADTVHDEAVLARQLKTDLQKQAKDDRRQAALARPAAADEKLQRTARATPVGDVRLR